MESKQERENEMETITRKFVWDTDFDSIRAIEVDGVTYVPVTGNRIDPELAKKRIEANKHSRGAWGYWGDAECEPGYWVTFHRSDSQLVSALGR